MLRSAALYYQTKCSFMAYSRYQVFNIVYIILLVPVCAGIASGFLPLWVLMPLAAVYLCMVAAGSYFIQMNFYFRSLNRLPRFKVTFGDAGTSITPRDKKVVLTFDDGPHANTATVLEILRKEDVRAVFFLIGKHAATHESLVRQLSEAGHQLGNHSYSHTASFGWQSAKGMAAEIERTNQVLEGITQEPVSLFRPPFGVTNPNLGKAIRRSGMLSVGWSIRSYDTVAKDEDRLIRRIMQRLHPGAVILLHERCDITVRILPVLIRKIRQQGYTFTTF